MLDSIVLNTMPMLCVSWSRNERCISLNFLNEASSITALTSSSNITGSMMMLRGAVEPSTEPTRR